MPVSKLSSVIIGSLTALVVAATLLYLQRAGWLDRGGDTFTALAAALAAGALVTVVGGVVLGRLDGELRRLCTHVENLDRPDHDTARFQPARGFADLAGAVDLATRRLRERIDHLSSQRRELEVHARLSDAERRHAEAVLNAIDEAVIVTNAFNEVVMANDAAGRLFAFAVRDARQRPLTRVIANRHLTELIRKTQESGSSTPGSPTRRKVELKLDPSGSGQIRVYEISMAWFGTLEAREPTSAEGREAGVVTVLRDITQEKEIAEQKSEFVSCVSHEMRTPLSSIKAYMEMLIDGEVADDDTRDEFYGIIQGEANRLGRLIDNLLSISRIESGVVKVQRELVSLPQIVHDVLDVMQPQARAKQIELNGDTTPRYAQVFADRDMVYQALLNLVGNAVKYTPDDGKVDIVIDLQREMNRVDVHVRDNGVGVPEDELPKLFDKFYRVNDHKNMAGGTGLGLNLVKHIIETVHGGTLNVKSSVDHGSTFTFSLPIAENDY